MATILDIAKLAGVSHGTVSNVLNGKGNVSSKKMELVLKAAEQLGYNLNNNAKLLRSGKSQTIIMILPTICADEYAAFYEGALRESSTRQYQIKLYCTYDNPLKERDILKEIVKERPSGIITVSSLADANEYYDQLSTYPSDIIFVNRQPRNAEEFITFDFKQAGEDIAEYVMLLDAQKIGLFTDEEDYASERDFITSFAKQMNHQHLVMSQSNMAHEYEASFELVQRASFDCIVTTSIAKAGKLIKAYHYGAAEPLPPIISLAPFQNTYSNEVQRYFLDYGYAGENAVKKVILNIHLKDKSHSKTYRNIGFLDKVVSYQQASDTQLKILTIESPTTRALKKIIPHFEKNTKIRVQLDVCRNDELFDVIKDDEQWKNYDIIRLDVVGLAWYGQKIFQYLQGLDDQLDHVLAQLPYFLKDDYANINDVTYALPFDISIQMLFYRKDLFENEMIKRKYFEKTKSELKIPTDFHTYNQILTFFNESDFDLVNGIHGASMITGKAETIVAEYLLRYYSLKGALLNDGEIKLDPALATEAMALLYDNYQHSKVVSSNWWGEEVKDFVEGKAAMVIGFMNHLSIVSQSSIRDSIGIANVPGDTPLLGGGILGITKTTDKRDESIEFLNWLNSNEISEQITLLGGNTSSYFLSNSSVVHSMYPWLNKAKKTMMNGKRESAFENGESIDIKQAEEIIGKHILSMLADEQPEFERYVEKVNEELQVKQADLITQM
ncbi:extracellular solute-binding protein [Bacillaceae bacterium SIJ1]|uniref:extracellular solute-binding protein n=1 Tax=Litoribacterium kuwaitense TaxID=1398745 RepID=UPI0013EA5A96|nr:extracellular solute-binding protein [Litoribacterium kuwaitense]NGP45642.1 extracellular solute-binding protein [Litoribacterium kuwaitense]